MDDADTVLDEAIDLIADPEDQAETGVRHLSPSSAGAFEQCPQRWRFRYLDRLPDPPGEAALAGTFAHRVLEVLLQLPPDERTPEQAKAIARTEWPDMAAHHEFVDLDLDERGSRRFRWVAWSAIEGLWALEDPRRVEVQATEQKVDATLGDVPFRGIVDRLDVEADGVVVTDYKSGRVPRPRYRKGRLAQVLLYAAAVRETLGEAPSRARLLYLGQRNVETVVDEQNLAEVIDQLSGTWADLQQACATDQFETRTGPLCAWCPYLEQCPAGLGEVTARHERGAVRLDAPGLAVLPDAS
ncbi:MAG: PD-(D/E)XK nuclease family protein [Acidimicrobiia bacterium]|nr:PD-(D/E)XK nuclease family protein [Acidimicrobiia bacterium]